MSDSHSHAPAVVRDLYGKTERPARLLKGSYSYAVQKFPKGVNLAWGVLVQWQQ